MKPRFDSVWDKLVWSMQNYPVQIHLVSDGTMNKSDKSIRSLHQYRRVSYSMEPIINQYNVLVYPSDQEPTSV